MTTYTLKASDLASKWGFSDGDLFDHMIDNTAESHHVLYMVVKKYLKPLLPERLELNFVYTHHNPVRASEEWAEFCRDSSVEVTVTIEEGWPEIDACFKTVHKALEGARSK